MKKYAGSILGGVGMLILILDSKTALEGAASGLEVCIRTVIPSLFPFILLSNLMVGQTFPAMRGLAFLGRSFLIPAGAEGLLIPAFLGGYPLGAQCIGTAYRGNGLTRQQAQRMLAFCSNAGPSFLFGMVGQMFDQTWVPWVLWGILILSALMVASIIPAESTPAQDAPIQKAQKPLIATAVGVMGQICGWVILFRVGITFLERWCLWLLPEPIQVAVMGVLELSNGCLALGKIQSIPLRLILCAGMLSFGGLCVGFQTASVVGDLSMGYYWLGKGLQTIFSLLLAGTMMGHAWAGGILLVLYFGLLMGYGRKNSSIPAIHGV